MPSVTPVKFANRRGLALFGVLHLPDPGPLRPVAILLLSPGIKMRVAPHRLYAKMANKLVALGFPVFRFDYHGLGDSEGEFGETVLVDIYNTIQDGRFVGDTIDAMDWLEREHGLSRFVVGGLCGGAISGLLTGEVDLRVEGLLALGIPASFEGSKEQYDQFMTRGELSSISRGYARKLLDPKALLRFFTFQSGYRLIWRSISQRLARARRDGEAPDTTNRSAMVNLNPKFGPAFLTMLRTGRQIILIFSGADRWRWEFEEKFEEPNTGLLEPVRALYEKHTIPNANHILSDEAWLATALQLSEAWLHKLYPV
jgi:hypothetical protein